MHAEMGDYNLPREVGDSTRPGLFAPRPGMRSGALGRAHGYERIRHFVHLKNRVREAAARGNVIIDDVQDRRNTARPDDWESRGSRGKIDVYSTIIIIRNIIQTTRINVHEVRNGRGRGRGRI